MTIRRALISVSDKTSIAALGRALAAADVQILSTGGTAKVLAEAGVPVTKVSDHTGSPEVFGGRVKTLHPKIHGGILFNRSLESHVSEATRQGIEAIDLVVVNLYPFAETIAEPDCTRSGAVEQIDIHSLNGIDDQDLCRPFVLSAPVSASGGRPIEACKDVANVRRGSEIDRGVGKVKPLRA